MGPRGENANGRYQFYFCEVVVRPKGPCGESCALRQSAVGETSVSQSTLLKVLNGLELGKVHLMAWDRFVDAPHET